MPAINVLTADDVRLAAEKLVRVVILIGSGVLAKYGIDNAQFTILAIDAAGAVATIAWGFWRSWQLRNSLPPQVQADDLDIPPQVRRTLVLLMLVGVAAAFAAGCSMEKKAYTLRVSYNAALREATALNKAGVIANDDYVAGVKIALAIRPMLDELDRSIAAGDRFNTEAAWTAASNVVSRFLEWLATTRAKH